MQLQQGAELGRGWGPFTGRQLTTIVCVAIISLVVIVPTAALAAVGKFTSTTAAPAVTGTNSSAAVNAKAVFGNASAGGNTTRYGVVGQATGTSGIGVQGTGKKFGVYSNGPLGVAAGKPLSCSGCVTGADLAPSAQAHCAGYPHKGVDWTIPGSTAGHGCGLEFAFLSQLMMQDAKLVNANLSSANLATTDLTGADLTGADLSDSDLQTTMLNGSNLSHADLSNAFMLSTTLEDANLTGASLVNASIQAADLFNANLTGANLSGADLTGATVFGVIWSNTTCPDLTNSNSHGNTCVGHGGGL